MDFQPPVTAQWPVRQPLIDLATPIPRRWFAGDPFKTAFFNSVSMTFVLASQFFSDSVLRGLQSLPIEERARFTPLVLGLVGQEAIHQRVHAQFNAQLEAQGFVNRIGARLERRRRVIVKLDPLHSLAIVAALGHFGIVGSAWMLSNPQFMAQVEPRIRDMWLWHAAEDAEHSCVAFNLFEALQGSLGLRRRWMRRVKLESCWQLALQTASNLWRDGVLFKWSTWREAAHFLFGSDGLLTAVRAQSRAFSKAGFDPAAFTKASHAQAWLQENRSKWTVARVSRPS